MGVGDGQQQDANLQQKRIKQNDRFQQVVKVRSNMVQAAMQQEEAP